MYGIFILALFTKRTNIVGVICGATVSYIFCPIAHNIIGVNWTWLHTINTTIVISVSYIVSIIYNRVTGIKVYSKYTWNYKIPE